MHHARKQSQYEHPPLLWKDAACDTILESDHRPSALGSVEADDLHGAGMVVRCVYVRRLCPYAMR